MQKICRKSTIHFVFKQNSLFIRLDRNESFKKVDTTFPALVGCRHLMLQNSFSYFIDIDNKRYIKKKYVNLLNKCDTTSIQLQMLSQNSEMPNLKSKK